jgi:hypothetical protein
MKQIEIKYRKILWTLKCIEHNYVLLNQLLRSVDDFIIIIIQSIINLKVMNYFTFLRRCLFILVIMGFGLIVFAQIPQTPSIQMLLTDDSGDPVADDFYSISVSLYDSQTGGTALWTETQNIDVTDGLANIILGIVTPLDLKFDKQYFVGLSINGGSEMTPRLELNPSAYSLSAKAVYGTDNIFPETGDVGIGTLLPHAKLDIEGKLRIAELPQVDTITKVLVQDTLNDQVVKSIRVDSLLHLLNKISWDFSWWSWPGNPGPPGPQGPAGPSGHTGVPGEDLLVRSADSTVVFSVNAETGESVHKGFEWFEEGFWVGPKDIDSKAGLTIKADGTYIVFNHMGDTMTIFNPDGTSYHAGREIFKSGITVSDDDSPAGVTLLSDGTLIITDNKGNETTRINPDGTSAHVGLELFKNGLKIPLANGGYIHISPEEGIQIYDPFNLVYHLDPGGNSFHKGIEIFEAGLRIPLVNGSYILISPDQGIQIFNTSGLVYQQDPFGNSYHKGLERFKGGIITKDSIDSSGTTPDELIPSIQAETVKAKLIKADEKQFCIDHPLDPENKYLSHSSIETNEIANIYNGNVMLDKQGSAEVKLPLWFQALNENFRYQLTPVGGPCPNLHISGEIENNRFKIGGGEPGMKVSWQIVGSRKDKYARENPLQVETFKKNANMSASIENKLNPKK